MSLQYHTQLMKQGKLVNEGIQNTIAEALVFANEEGEVGNSVYISEAYQLADGDYEDADTVFIYVIETEDKEVN